MKNIEETLATSIIKPQTTKSEKHIIAPNFYVYVPTIKEVVNPSTPIGQTPYLMTGFALKRMRLSFSNDRQIFLFQEDTPIGYLAGSFEY